MANGFGIAHLHDLEWRLACSLAYHQTRAQGWSNCNHDVTATFLTILTRTELVELGNTVDSVLQDSSKV
ncbi:hypothetical protein PAXRUDRAFT_835259 [Paxillus rubicundulus Ve08.2h10]|uniref:Uncharacterized protein n=1 Tax=Paxillus rubicundulus Ve08.2h10 TaxID=930991 RepID=A0A0D0C066_9AGAM|nr:hypothetical protein PAXRUDRAFT_835259 [Paxillus rubicundulus Ve08.2h10]